MLLYVYYIEWENSEILTLFLLASVQKNDLLPRLLECRALLITLMNQNQSAEHGFPHVVWWQVSKLVWNRYFSIGYHPLKLAEQQKSDPRAPKFSQMDRYPLLSLLAGYCENLLGADAQCCVLLVKGGNSPLWRVFNHSGV